MGFPIYARMNRTGKNIDGHRRRPSRQTKRSLRTWSWHWQMARLTLCQSAIHCSWASRQLILTDNSKYSPFESCMREVLSTRQRVHLNTRSGCRYSISKYIHHYDSPWKADRTSPAIHKHAPDNHRSSDHPYKYARIRGTDENIVSHGCGNRRPSFNQHDMTWASSSSSGLLWPTTWSTQGWYETVVTRSIREMLLVFTYRWCRVLGGDNEEENLYPSLWL